jgi:hypothetical protein
MQALKAYFSEKRKWNFVDTFYIRRAFVRASSLYVEKKTN